MRTRDIVIQRNTAAFVGVTQRSNGGAAQLELNEIIEAYKDTYPPTLNTSQVAEMLGSTAEVVRSKVASGEIPAYRWGKNFRYFRDEVLDWLHHQSVKAPTEELGQTTSTTRQDENGA